MSSGEVLGGAGAAAGGGLGQVGATFPWSLLCPGLPLSQSWRILEHPGLGCAEMSGSRAMRRGQGYVREWPQRVWVFQAPRRGWGSTVFFLDVSQLFSTAATNPPCAYSSQAFVGPPCSLSYQELRQSSRVMGTDVKDVGNAAWAQVTSI